MEGEVPLLEKKPKRRWVRILVGIIVILLLVLVILRIYSEISYKKYLHSQGEALYSLLMCVDYCPYVEIYHEQNTLDGIVKRNINRINPECFDTCISINSKRIIEGAFPSKLTEYLIETLISNNHEMSLYEEKSVEFSSLSECFLEVFEGEGKDCLKETLESYSKLSTEFKIPIYKNIILEFEDLTCKPEEIIAKINLIEGDIIGMFFRISEEGSSVNVEKIFNVVKGTNEVVIKNEEYNEFRNVSMVTFNYVVEDETSGSGRRISGGLSRLCNN